MKPQEILEALRRPFAIRIGRPAKQVARRDVTLREGILMLFEASREPPTVYEGPKPRGVKGLRRLTPDAFEVEFDDEVDSGLLRQVAGSRYSVKTHDMAGSNVWRFPPKVIRDGEIVAYVSRSRRAIVLLLYPPSWQWTTYRKVLAERRGIRGFREAYAANTDAIELVEKYRLRRYEQPLS
ncbi:MAG: hypothetical protein QW057_02830 [Candidatus Bathyarchaeia archaeon]